MGDPTRGPRYRQLPLWRDAMGPVGAASAALFRERIGAKAPPTEPIPVGTASAAILEARFDMGA